RRRRAARGQPHRTAGARWRSRRHPRPDGGDRAAAPRRGGHGAMRIAFDARMDGAERADWWRALTDALPDDDWIDPAVEGTNSLRWREADIAVVANPQPGRLANCTQLQLIQS